MSGFLGQIPEEVEALAAEFDNKAGDVETLIAAITQRLQSTTWRGADREAFEASWSGEMTNNLTQLANALRETGQIANNNAQQQRTASS
ncbi:MAG TPA: WXG100 family type VII secretion target [Protaetiibacter sp.]|nr:WXG100 family type VII secretion target [Protaetiibacter sp.]